jgi:tetratricopeptide (TPR) repeat protein/transglutaminase-like putative cysteine protease
MCRKELFLALAFSALARVGLAQGQAQPSAVDPFKNEAVVIERSETTYRMQADGTGERDLHVILRIQSAGAAQQFGVLTFGYASASETPVIKYLRVHKADGTTVETPASDAMDMPADVTREAPLYSDLKEKHLPVRSLSPGDKLEYEVDTAIIKPEAPGQFWGSDHFVAPGTVVVLAEILTLDVPSDKYVQVWSPNHKPVVSEQNGREIYSWNVPQLVTAPKNTGDESSKPVLPKDPDEDDQGRKLPSVAWTTFHTWSEVGDWYRGLALKQAEPNDALRARADEFTAKAQTPEDQVRDLYEFVSARTRYIGIDFGIGRYQPHTAAEVLADQYGDCKDKDTLLEALLRAKGFSTAPALIGVGLGAVPEVPSPGSFNHVITTVNLPGGRIWLDSTPMVAPYRYLVAAIRDQKALVVPANTAATLESTPANAPYPFVERFDAAGSLDAEGKLTAKMTASYRDDDEIMVRAMAISVGSAEWDKISQYISSITGFGGTTSNTQFQNNTDTSQPIELTYDYSRHPYGEWDDHRIVPLFPALEFTALDSETTVPQEDIQLGAPRTLKAVSHIRLPAGFDADLPDPIHVKTDFATFDKTYLFQNGEIIAERDIVILKNKVPKTEWKKYLSFTKDISLSGESWIQLLGPEVSRKYTPVHPPSEPAGRPKLQARPGGTISVQQLQAEQAAKNNPTSPNAAPAAGDESIGELKDTAQQKMRAQDWEGAKETLDRIKAKNPDEEGLWSMYGFLVEVMDRDYETAAADFSKELAAHPDNATVVIALSEAQDRSGDSSGARETLQRYFDRHPDNASLAMYLANLENNSDDKLGALKTLETATKQSPDDRNLRVLLSQTLVSLDRMQEAAAAAKSALDGTDDPQVLNDAAYELGETGIDLDIAEDAARKSIAKQDEKSATITTGSANTFAFYLSNLLTASWDTLGWILFKEGKLDAAQTMLVPAWRAGMKAENGDHLGQLYEAEGKKNEASVAYTLAQGALDKNTSPDVRRHITERLARLKQEDAEPGPANITQALQDLRTYRIPRPEGASGWGAFRLEITTAGVIESQQMSGEAQIAAVKPSLDAMKFPELLPPDSKAHLLRSAVVSCSLTKMCEVVLVPDGGLQTEQQ